MLFPGQVWVKKLTQDCRFRLAAWNIEILICKFLELVNTLIRRKVTVTCLQETKQVGEKAKEIEKTVHKIYYARKDETQKWFKNNCG